MKTVVITGASSGIGFETARLLARLGYSVIGVGRSGENCRHAREKIEAEAPSANVSFIAADLMHQREVNRAAAEIAALLEKENGGYLHALINNAGCVRSWYTTTEEGYEQQFALNVLAGFLLTYRLLPCLAKGGGRVIMTSSASHKGIKVRWDDPMFSRRYNPLTAYKQSKLCNLLFARGLNELYKYAGISAYGVDPGLVRTDIGNKQTGFVVNLVWSLRKRWGTSPEIPAKTFAFLCDEPAAGGFYYYNCRERRCSSQVTAENAARLFELGERLCGIKYPEVIA
jgi:NAD(P)-dependent dehydrogenase (short-subunit alcohol dehydrogenase family)